MAQTNKGGSLLHELLQKEMSRKEFIVHVGGVFLAVIGVTGLLKKLTDPFGKTTASRASQGYGSSPYGGAAEVAKRS